MREKNRIASLFVLAAAAALIAVVPLNALAAGAGQTGTNKLIVNGPDGTTPKFVVQSVVDNNFNPVRNYGFLGIGTSNPNIGIHVVGNNSAQTQITSQSVSLDPPGAPALLGGGFTAMFNYNDAGTAPNYNHPRNGDRLGYFLFGAQMQDGAIRNAAGVSALAEGDWTNSSTPGSFAFQTAPSGSNSRVERFRITNSGNIGANTSTPQATLDVNGSFRINPSNTGAVVVTKPTCTDSIRGTFWFTPGSADALEICAQKSAGAPQWYPVSF